MTSKPSLAARLFPFSWKDLLTSAVIFSFAIGFCVWRTAVTALPRQYLFWRFFWSPA